MREKSFFVYILASQKNGSLYTGMTNALQTRTLEHKNKANSKSHMAKYNITRLVYYEHHDTPDSAIDREMFIKKHTRKYKIKLIEKDNPDWSELYWRLSKTDI